MTTLVRWTLCLAWMAGAAWLWQTGVLGAFAASALAVPALWLVRAPRRRRSGLQYVQMAKAPVAVP